MNSQPNITPNYNMLSVFKTSKTLYILSFIILIMIIGMFMIIFNIKIPSNIPSLDKSNEQVTYNVLIIMFVLMLVISISIRLLPDSYKIFDFFSQIKWVIFIFIYTISLILFFRMTPVDIVNKYANIILPISALIGIILFYNGATTNYINQFNVNYERIKSILMLFCFIIIIALDV